MSNSDWAMIQYLELAKISQAQRQLAGRDKFLILAGVAACRSGLLDIAEACRDHVLKHNPHHLLGRWPSLPDALRSEDFAAFHHQLERFCGVEKAESLLAGLNASIVFDESLSASDFASQQLEHNCWQDKIPVTPDESRTRANGKTD
jgi:hypothetical protein